MKIRKTFLYDGIELKIAEVRENYLDGTSFVVMTRVISPNGGNVPVKINRGQSLKSIQEETINLLNEFKARGADVIKELTYKDMEDKVKDAFEIIRTEINDLEEALKDAEKDLKEEQETSTKKDKRIEELEEDIEKLENEISEQPNTSQLNDLMKYEAIVEHFNEFTLDQFELFLKVKELW